MGRDFMGYMRPSGKVGVRNFIAIVPSVFCANTTAQQIASRVNGAVALRHPVGCGQVGYDFELTARTLIAMGTHPNVAAAVVVGLGCERFTPEELFNGIRAAGTPASLFVIQDEGGTTRTIEHAVRAAEQHALDAQKLRRESFPVSELMVALKCGGTDATSGLAANPTLGAMSDMLTEDGGSVIFSELNELLGTEEMLAKRAVDGTVAKKIYRAIYGIEEVLRSGCDDRYPGRNELISPGNFSGGVSSIVEKALGGVHKSGESPIVDVLEYAVPPKKDKKGAFLMNYESHDGEVVTGMIGCGAQIVAFTTGRGNPTGFPFVPVVKVTGNEFTYERMLENCDFCASEIISSEVPIREMGERFYNLIVKVASGEKTKAELLGADELFCVARRPGPQTHVIEAEVRGECAYR
jgi:altronate dehydratase large subunit